MWRSRILFFLVFAGTFGLIRFPDWSDIGFALLYALLLLAAASLVAVLTARFFLKIDEHADRRELFKKDEFRYEAILRNCGLFFYPRIRLRLHNAELMDYGEIPAGIVPRGEIRIDRQLCLPYRGVYKLGVRGITVTDFLGLFRVTFRVDHPMTVTVYPKGDEDFSIYIRGYSQDAAFRRDPGNESYADVADVRKYTSADTFRKIHWKLSAKRGELMVKSFHSFDPARTLLFLDTLELPFTGAQRAAFEDKMIGFAASAINHCMGSRLPASLIYGDGPGDQEDIDPAEHPDRLYRLLAEIPFNRPCSPFPVFYETRMREISMCNLVLFLSAMDGPVLDALIHIAPSDRSLMVYYFHAGSAPGPEARQALNSLRACGVTVNCVEVPLPPDP